MNKRKFVHETTTTTATTTSVLIFGYTGNAASTIVDYLDTYYSLIYMKDVEEEERQKISSSSSSTKEGKEEEDKSDLIVQQQLRLKLLKTRYSEGGCSVPKNESIDEKEERLGDLMCSLMQTNKAKVRILQDTPHQRGGNNCYISLDTIGSITSEPLKQNDENPFGKYNCETFNHIPTVVDHKGGRDGMTKMHRKLFEKLGDVLGFEVPVTMVDPPNYHLINFYNKN